MARIPISDGLPQEQPIADRLVGIEQNQAALSRLTESSLRLVEVRAARNAQQELDSNVTSFSIAIERAHEEAIKSGEIDNLVESLSGPMTSLMAEQANSFTTSKESQDQFLMRTTSMLNSARMSLTQEQLVREGLREDALLANNYLQIENRALAFGYAGRKDAFLEIDHVTQNHGRVTQESQEVTLSRANAQKANFEHALALDLITNGNAEWVEETIEDPEKWEFTDAGLRVNIRRLAHERRMDDFVSEQEIGIRRHPDAYSDEMIQEWRDEGEIDVQRQSALQGFLMSANSVFNSAISELEEEMEWGRTPFVPGDSKARKIGNRVFNKYFADISGGQLFNASNPDHAAALTVFQSNFHPLMPEIVAKHIIALVNDEEVADPDASFAAIALLHAQRQNIGTGSADMQIRKYGADASFFNKIAAIQEGFEAHGPEEPNYKRRILQAAFRVNAQRMKTPEDTENWQTQTMRTALYSENWLGKAVTSSEGLKGPTLQRAYLKKLFEETDSDSLRKNVFPDRARMGAFEPFLSNSIPGFKVDFDDVLDRLDIENFDEMSPLFIEEWSMGYKFLLDDGVNPRDAAKQSLSAQMSDWGVSSINAESYNEDGIGLAKEPYEWYLAGKETWTPEESNFAALSDLQQALDAGAIPFEMFTSETDFMDRWDAAGAQMVDEDEHLYNETFIGTRPEAREGLDDDTASFGDVGGAIGRSINGIPIRVMAPFLSFFAAAGGAGDPDVARNFGKLLWALGNTRRDLGQRGGGEYGFRFLSPIESTRNLMTTSATENIINLRVSLDRGAYDSGQRGPKHDDGTPGGPLYNFHVLDKNGNEMLVPSPVTKDQIKRIGEPLRVDPTRNQLAQHLVQQQRDLNASDDNLERVAEAISNRSFERMGWEASKDPNEIQKWRKFLMEADLLIKQGNKSWLTAAIANGLIDEPEKYRPLAIAMVQKEMDRQHESISDESGE